MLFDYNRYMYVRGNPLKYTDPTGHCATIASTGAPDRNNDPDCWRYVDSILNVWDEESPYGYEYGYWERRFTSKEVFGLMAQQSFNDTGFFMQEFNQYNDYKDAADQKMSELLQEYAQHNPSPGRDFFHPCLEVWDCTAITYDLVSIGASMIGDSALAAGPFGVPITVAAKAADYSATSAGTLRTIQQVQTGKATRIDLIVSSYTASSSVIPGAGEFAGVIQLLWDLFDPFHPW